ncbi:MAG: uracil-DNA glycosylase [Planctomycetota bacterium]|nr:uracil-DNA glycosylase [Planctomycetota bacterium]
MPINRAAIGSTRHCGDVGESSGTSGPSGAAVRPGRAALLGGGPAQGELTFATPDDHHRPAQLPACEKPQALEALRARHDGTCPHCTQATAHTHTVFGEGNPDAALMFIGEAPGEEEDRTGRPFVGRAGRKLDDIIKAMGWRREEVYIANVLKSRPPGNRTPLAGEVEVCTEFLAEQIRIIRPQVIVGLGSPATKWLLGTNQGITRLRGQWAAYTDGALSIPVMPTFHTAYLLRNYTAETRARVWSDMQAVMAVLRPLDARTER